MDEIQGSLNKALGINKEQHREPLANTVRTTLQFYFYNLDGHNPVFIYKMVITEVERSMFETVMEYVKGNQSRAAKILGISRSTLRKKLKIYDLE